MTDYNDGKWYRWYGDGRKPDSVHPRSRIQYHWFDRETGKHRVAERLAGFDDRDIEPAWGLIAFFRVTKVHREPREFWVNVYYENVERVSLYASREMADKMASEYRTECIRVREVPDE